MANRPSAARSGGTTGAAAWVDRSAYPFEPRSLEVDGGRMHYVDEGTGRVVVMVHGTPTWSFLYRRLIADLARSHRVIAPDHVGFGLSEKPRGWSYRPEDHARNLAALIDRLELRDITLVVHDFGGPIGLSYAVEHPENVRALVLFNTWMWSLSGTPAARLSRFAAGPVGRFLYRRLNVSPRLLVKAAFADKHKLSRDVHRHYVAAFPSPAQRVGPWVLARELIGSSDWYDGLWQRRDRIAHLPALLLWGMRDPAFGPAALARWRELFPDAAAIEFPEVGHFVQEEAPEAAASEIARFLASLD